MSAPTTEKTEAPETTPQAPSKGPVQFTEEAVKKVNEALESEGKKGFGLRVGVVGGGCAGFQYTLDFCETARPGDTQWDEDGFTVYVDKMSIAYLMGTQIDYTSSPMGSGFKFGNPNVTTTCGCGQSFA